MKKIIAITSLIATATLASCTQKEAETTTKPSTPTPQKVSTTTESTTETTTTGATDTGATDTGATDTGATTSIAVTTSGAIATSGSTSEITNIAQEMESAIIPGESITKEVSYQSPGGMEAMEVTLVTNNQVITSVNITPKSGNDIGKNFQTQFIGAINKEVIGKKKSELNLHAVAGASLTTDVFMKFIKSN